MTSRQLFLALCIVWAISQLWIARRRSADRSKARDRGTLDLLIVTIFFSLALGTWLAWRDAGRIAAHRDLLLWLGMAMMVAGLLLRWWAVRVLDRFFTVDIAIHPGQELIRSGPYRLLRHPSYTGALLTFYGFALALGNAWSLLVIVIPVSAAFVWRIFVEERMLQEAFPTDYPAYARRTKRLIPYIW
jgi:protein-S-isoprenylcysteine O-methyltransferase